VRLTRVSKELKSLTIPKSKHLDDEIARLRSIVNDMTSNIDGIEERVGVLLQEQDGLDKKVGEVRDDTEKTRYQVDVLPSRTKEAGEGVNVFVERVKN
jgi:uncharacterized protein YoxC